MAPITLLSHTKNNKAKLKRKNCKKINSKKRHLMLFLFAINRWLYILNPLKEREQASPELLSAG